MLQPPASRKSKHLPPAIVVLGPDTCDPGRVTLWRGRGSAPAPRRPSLKKRAADRHLLILGPTRSRIGRYQTKKIESSGPGLECLDDAVAKFDKALLLLAAGRLHYAQCRGRADESRCAGCREGRATSRVHNKVHFPSQVSGAQAKAKVRQT